MRVPLADAWVDICPAVGQIVMHASYSRHITYLLKRAPEKGTQPMPAVKILTTELDVLIVGAGHNGLTAGSYR